MRTFGDFGSFPGFSSADLRDIAIAMHVCVWFLAICGRSANAGGSGLARDLDSLKNAWISRFQLSPVYFSTIWVRL